MPFGSLGEMLRFVQDLDVPEARREIVESELLDHFFARIAEGLAERDALAAFGAPEALRIRFESAEKPFAFTLADAARDGARFGVGLFLGLALSDVVLSIVLDGLFGLLPFDPTRRHWLFWSVMKHSVNPLLWTLGVVIPLAVLHRLRPRRRSTAAIGRVALQPGATTLFLVIACGVGLAGALFAEDLGASLLTRIGIDAATPDANGRLLDLALWLLTAALALFHLPLRGHRAGLADTSTSDV